MIRVRFAPTPTGNLFVSGLRVALANYLFARRNSGEMLLRIDDLDPERSIHADQIMQDLRWAGIDWTNSFRQSERLELYQDTIEGLKKDKFIYPCFESDEELKAKAILEPTPDNVIAYVRYQREQLDRASTFTDVWERAIWQHSDLDYTLQRPVDTLGKTAWLAQRKTDQEAVMASLSERYGLFLFYSASCGACEVFSPIVRTLADKYNISVLAVSMDGGPNPNFPRFVVNHGQYQKMGLSGGQVPALVLFDTYLKKPIPIGYGVMAEDEVMSRIFTLTSVKPGSDF